MVDSLLTGKEQCQLYRVLAASITLNTSLASLALTGTPATASAPEITESHVLIWLLCGRRVDADAGCPGLSRLKSQANNGAQCAASKLNDNIAQLISACLPPYDTQADKSSEVSRTERGEITRR
jgi:hypothetical protein